MNWQRFVFAAIAVPVLLAGLLAFACSGKEQPAGSQPGVAATPAPVQSPATATRPPAGEVQPPSPRPLPSRTGLGKLAYIKGGDLWIQELDLDQERQLTSGGGVQLPRWSASGEWLLFLRGGRDKAEFWVIRQDGSGERKLEPQSAELAQWTPADVAWSPWADVLAFALTGGSLVVEDADGAYRRILLPALPNAAAPAGRSNPLWSPDAEWIAFNEYMGPPRAGRIEAVRVDTGEEKELVSPTPDQVDCVDLRGWSGDSKNVLFSAQVCSASLRADGLALHAVSLANPGPLRPTAQQLTDGSVTLLYTDFISAAPDSAIAAITDGGGRETWTTKSVSLFDAASGAAKSLTEPNVAAFSPAWSPDSTKIVYVSGLDIGRVGGGEPARLGAAQRRIWIMNADGSGKVQLTGDDAYRDEYPAWAADGSQILFARLDSDNQASVWMVPSTGGAPMKVTDVSAPTPSFTTPWFGYYGHITWEYLYDYWAGPTSP